MNSTSSKPTTATVAISCPHGSARMSPPSANYQCSGCGFEVKIIELAKPESQRLTGTSPEWLRRTKDLQSTPGSAAKRDAYSTYMSRQNSVEAELARDSLDWHLGYRTPPTSPGLMEPLKNTPVPGRHGFDFGESLYAPGTK